MFLVLGLAALLIALDYPMGSAGRMGPGFFPRALAALLALIGLAGMGRSLLRDGEGIGKFHLRELGLVLSAVILFGALIRGAGLAPAVIGLVLVSAYAGPRFTWTPNLVLAAGLAAFGVLVFARLLGLPIAALGPWLGF